MPSFLRPLLGRVIPALGMVLLAWIAWHKVDNWCNGACRDARAEAQQYGEQLKQARERSTALALLWAEAINRVEVKYVEVERSRTVAAAGLRERAGRIRSDTDGVRIRVPPAALRVLGDAANLANDTAPPAGDSGPGQAVPDPAGPAETTLTDWLEFAINAAEAYRDAEDKHLACVAAYEAIRNGQAQGIPSSGPDMGQ